MKFWYLNIFRKFVKKNVTRFTGTVHEDLSAFMVISRSIFLE